MKIGESKPLISKWVIAPMLVEANNVVETGAGRGRNGTDWDRARGVSVPERGWY